MTRALILSLRDWYASQPTARPIRRVRLLVGQFTGVEPDLLRNAFARQKMDTSFLREAELIIRESVFVAHCRPCAQEYRPDIGLHYACPTCGAALDEIRSGRELKIERVEWDSDDAAA